MLRVVLDTNVYVSAFVFGGPPLEILTLGIRDHIAVFVSAPILKEIQAVLQSKFEWPTRDVREALDAIDAFGSLVVPREAVAVIKDDEPDNRILECAVEGSAHVIVSGDKHLRALRAYRRIAIMSPREFLDALSAGVFSAV